jgi:hypothetical protein
MATNLARKGTSGGSMVASKWTAIENRTFATEGNYSGEEREGYGKKVRKDIMLFLSRFKIMFVRLRSYLRIILILFLQTTIFLCSFIFHVRLN